MELDFSLLTFSPSHVKKNSKIPNLNKKYSKFSLKHRYQHSTNTAKEAQRKWPSPNLKNVQEAISKTDSTISDNQPCLTSCDKVKIRSSKGKENRRISSPLLDLPKDIDWQTSNASNSEHRCRRLSSDYHENSSSIIKCCPNEVAKEFSKSDIFISKRTTSACSLDYLTYSNSDNPTKSQNVSSYTSLDCNLFKLEVGSKYSKQLSIGNEINKVNDSIVVISDCSSTSSVGLNSGSKFVNQVSLSKNTEYKKSPPKSRPTIILESSESEIEIVENSFDTPKGLKPLLISSSTSKINRKSRYNKQEKPIADYILGLPSQSTFLNPTKYKDIENWVSKIQFQKSESDEKGILDIDLEQKCYAEISTKNVYNLNLTGKDFDNLCDSSLQVKVQKNGSETEPIKRKSSRNISTSKQTDYKKQKGNRSSLSSTGTEQFENFLKNLRHDFKSTQQKFDNSFGRKSDFINEEEEEDDDNSFGFYQAILHSQRKDNVQKDIFWKRKVNDIGNGDGDNNINRRLSYSSTEGSAESNVSNVKKNVKKINSSVKKITIKQSHKILGSPVKQVLVKKTPKTRNTIRVKSCLRENNNKNCVEDLRSFLASLSAGTPSRICHPEAQYFKKNFKKRKEELCKRLFQIYNENVFDNKLPNEILLEWNVRLKRTAGFCYNRKILASPGSKIRTSRIVLSTKVCDTADRLRDTLLHEMCHAATWIIDNVKVGHGPLWEAWARKARCIFPELPPVQRCHDYKIQTKFTYRCKGCGYSIGRHSKSLDIVTKRCGHCYGEFELLVNTRRKSGTVMQKTPKKRSPVAFARFVKENYKTMKESRADLKHGDVMRLLSQQFSNVKIGSKVTK